MTFDPIKIQGSLIPLMQVPDSVAEDAEGRDGGEEDPLQPELQLGVLFHLL